MGIPLIRPPPRRDGETDEQYYLARSDVQAWRRLTMKAAHESRLAFQQGLPLVVAAVIVVAVAIFAVLAAGCTAPSGYPVTASDPYGLCSDGVHRCGVAAWRRFGGSIHPQPWWARKHCK